MSNAFFKSIKIPQVYLLLFIFLCITFRMSRIACCVLWPPLKPNWELVKVLFLEIYLTSLSYMIFSKHLLKIESKEIGL